MIRRAVSSYRWHVPFEDLQRDAELAAAEFETLKPDSMDLIKSVFFRGRGAYIVGRWWSGSKSSPIAFSLLNSSSGIRVDAVLLTEDEVSILFSFTRSYFHVQTDCAFELVQFLKSIMPRKPIAELYISIGRNKHGKTEFYRDLLQHLSETSDLFEIAPGARGMVMIVFTLPSYEVVFKIIKDRFDHPKRTTRREVMEKYRLVFAHDRAGRLVDAQEFEQLRFERSRFSERLLEELLSVASESVTADDRWVVIHHVYTERRLTPLDLYMRSAESASVAAAVLDFGNALKDLARANIFPGDVLAKNFGVTRHGRVVSYDYDELCLVTDCNFRVVPTASNMEDELSADPWFYVGDNDYFPEEFPRFLGIPDRWKELFSAAHSDLYSSEFWTAIQRRIQSGEVIQIFPYPETKHLGNR
jgi:isocitrate dehydrogenase kinase/phosphatase